MSKALIYTVNSGSVAVSAGSQIPLGNIVRKYGCINSTGYSILLPESGYYSIDLNAVFTSTAGNVKIDILQDGNPVVGGSATQTAEASTTYSIGVDSVVRVYCHQNSVLTAVVDSASTGTPTFSSISMVVVKE